MLYICDQYGNIVRTLTEPLPKPLPQPGNPPEKDGTVVLFPLQYVDVIANSTFARIQPRFNGTALVRISSNTTGVLSQTSETIGGAQVNNTDQLSGGAQLIAGQGRIVPIPVEKDIVYSLSFSVAARLTVQVTGFPGVALAETNTVQLSGSIALYDGQASVTTSADALPSQIGTEVVLQADPLNTANILLGSSISSQHMVLSAGASMSLSIANLNLIFAVAVSGTQKLNWMVRS